MVDALRHISDTADHHKMTLRTATFSVACERILRNARSAGCAPNERVARATTRTP